MAGQSEWVMYSPLPHLQKISGVVFKIFCGGPLATPPLACLFVRKIKSEGPNFRKSAGVPF
jgi:hypothetical protein